MHPLCMALLSGYAVREGTTLLAHGYPWQAIECVYLLQAVTELLKLAPSTATLVTRDDSGRVVTEEEVPTVLIQRGDLLKVCALAPGAPLSCLIVAAWTGIGAYSST